MIDILPARTASPQVRSQPNRQQSPSVIVLLSQRTLMIAIFGIMAVLFASDRAARSEAARHVVDRLSANKRDGKGG